MANKITILLLLFITGFGFSQEKSKPDKPQKVAVALVFSVDGNWSLASNWSPAQVPTSGDNVTIPNSRLCILNTTGAVANNLTIDVGGTLNVNSGASLTVGGTLTSNGTVSVKSDASNSASVITGVFSGSLTYQRYLTGGANWHLISSPVVSQNITAFISSFGASMTQSGVLYSLAPYDNSFAPGTSEAWANYSTDGSNPAPASSFVLGKGYEILMNGDGTVDFIGSIPTSTVNIAITDNVSAWNLVGNPFPSSIFGNVGADATNNFLTVNSASLDPSFVAMYVWNPVAGSYDLVNQSTAARSLAPGQGFFVKSKAGGSSVNFTTAMQTHQFTNAFQKVATTGIPTISLIADNNSGTESRTEIKYMTGTTLGLDPGYDAGRFGAVGTGFNVYTHLVQDNGVAFALQVVPDTGYDTTVIPIGLDANAGTQITFKAATTDFPVGKKVFFEDRLLGAVTEINSTDKFYTVTLSSTLSGTGRFYLHTQDNASTLSTDDFIKVQFTLVASPKTNSLKLYGTIAQKGAISIYDSLGRMIYTTSLQTGTEQDIRVPTMTPGVYFVKIKADTKPFSKKIMWY